MILLQRFQLHFDLSGLEFSMWSIFTGGGVLAIFLIGMTIGLVVRKRKQIPLRDHWSAMLWRSALTLLIVAGIPTLFAVFFAGPLKRSTWQTLDDLAPTVPVAAAVIVFGIALLVRYQQKQRAA